MKTYRFKLLSGYLEFNIPAETLVLAYIELEKMGFIADEVEFIEMIVIN